MSERKTQADEKQVAAHSDESNRQEGHGEPGGRLTQRVDRNSQRAEEAAATAHKGGGTASDKPDPMKP